MRYLCLNLMIAFGVFASTSCASTDVATRKSVQTGIDVLQASNYETLAGQRVGLISNHTGVNRNGTSTIELLHKSPRVMLSAIFSPEHGIRGVLDVANIEDATDSGTGLKIYSLYGATRQPTAEMLDGIDTLVFDIQDIGTRFYTYISTMGLAMQAAASNNIQFVVLDRPNPINGITVSGPVLDAGSESFVGFHPIPVRHGMTVGELARLFRDELVPALDLVIVPMQHWKRGDFFDETGLGWINPSPNMRSLKAAVLYPGIGLLETTNLSVGRGTATPFEVLGAPWLDGHELAKHLNQLNFQGVQIQATTFSPTASKFQNEVCQGIRMSLLDPEVAEPIHLGIAIAVHLAKNYPGIWEVDAYHRLLGNTRTLTEIKRSTEATAIIALWESELKKFAKRRANALLYDE